MKAKLLSLIMMLGISLTMCACSHDNDEPIQKEADIPIFSIICNHNQTYTLTAVGVATVVSLGRSIIKH